jgi:hypothetical protein
VIAHVVLLTPRPTLSDAERQAAIAALARTAGDVPEIRRFRIGRRVTHGLPGYEQQMTQDYQVALLIEVDDIASLTRYLRAPAHAALGHFFQTATAAALAYDYEIVDPVHAHTLWA